MRKGKAMEENAYETLCRIRERVQALSRVQDSLARLEAVYKSPSFDGMPGGGGAGDAMDRRMCALEEMGGMAREIENEVRELTEAVRPVLAGMPDHLHIFCVTYYMAARSIRDVCMVMQRAKATVMEYKRELREWLENEN